LVAGKNALFVLTPRRLALLAIIAGLLVFTGFSDARLPKAMAQSTLSAPILPNTLGEQKTLVVLVNFQNNPTSQPYTVDQVRSVVFGSVSNFFYEGSYNQTWLAGDIYGWTTIPMNSTVCDTRAMADYANAAAAGAGANLSAYTRYVYIFPRNACSFNGYTATATNAIPRVYMNGDLSVKDVAHELGHSFGLDHAEALDCGSASIGSSCSMIDYGDKFDDMGGGSIHFNAYQKERLGWLNGSAFAPSITTVQGSGTYFVEPLETLSAGGSKALKILKSIDPVTGDKTWYYLELRQPVGFDGSLAGNSNVTNGVLIHQATQFSDSFNLFYSYLLDMTPETSSWLDPALTVGRTFQDGSAGFSVTPVACSSAGCSILVSFSSEAAQCVNTAPTITMTPVQPAAVQPGSSVTFTVTVKNNDTASCSGGTFNLQASIPSGWSAVFGSPTIALSPGSSASTSLNVTSPGSAVAGSYGIATQATNSAALNYFGSASAVFSVAAPAPSASVSISTDRSSYNLNQTATMKGIVSAAGSPVVGATVNFTMTKSNGAVVVASGVTGTDGVAVVKYRFNKKDPKGTYQDKAATTVNGTMVSGLTSFVVQ
jgi:hypothetical protein